MDIIILENCLTTSIKVEPYIPPNQAIPIIGIFINKIKHTHTRAHTHPKGTHTAPKDTKQCSS